MVFEEGAEEGCVGAGGFHGVEAIDEVGEGAGGGLEALRYPIVSVFLSVTDSVMGPESGWVGELRWEAEGRSGSIRGEVQDSGHVCLVRTHIRRISVEDLAQDVDAPGSGLEGGPEAGIDLLDRVDAQAVDGVVGDELGDPCVEDGLNVGVFGAQVGKGDGVGAHPALWAN